MKNRKIKEKNKSENTVVALAGNPNVGKSTVFNGLTGLNQHTGNWCGKTVSTACGQYRHGGKTYTVVDIPGAYSLNANSGEESIARDFIVSGNADITVIVADGTCLERNLNLVLQILEISDRVILCVNLLDEAAKRKIHIDLKKLSEILGIAVVGTSAGKKTGLADLTEIIARTAENRNPGNPLRITYPDEIEQAVLKLTPVLKNLSADNTGGIFNDTKIRRIALRILENGDTEIENLHGIPDNFPGREIENKIGDLKNVLGETYEFLENCGIPQDSISQIITKRLIGMCEEIYSRTVSGGESKYKDRDKKIDKFLTSKFTGILVMILGLSVILWLTLSGTNIISDFLGAKLFGLIEPLYYFFDLISAPVRLKGLIVDGVYKTLAWVVSVMLPPMAVFFPLFTLLEDLGYLPRAAFNLDNFFRKADAHGKQALTTCMVYTNLYSLCCCFSRFMSWHRTYGVV